MLGIRYGSVVVLGPMLFSSSGSAFFAHNLAGYMSNSGAVASAPFRKVRRANGRDIAPSIVSLAPVASSVLLIRVFINGPP